EKGTNLGTVTMNINLAGVTRFYAFSPDGKLLPAAVLDAEGAKFLPNVCTNCHGGQYIGGAACADNKANCNDLGGVFREFEPSLLDRPWDKTPDEAEEQWYQLNQIVRAANLAVRSEAEGGRSGVDHAKEAINTYIDEMYFGPHYAVDYGDARHVPM